MGTAVLALAVSVRAQDEVKVAPAAAPQVTGAAPFPAVDVAPPPGPVFDVHRYGAKGDGTTHDTAAIQKAIDACAGSGGSVLLSGGSFVSGQLELKGDMTFYVAKGAVLLGGTEKADYPLLVPKEILESDMWDLEIKNAQRGLLYAYKADKLRIDGGGIIDLRGQINAAQRKYDNSPSILRFYMSRGVIVRNVTLQNSRMWTQPYVACDDLLVENVTVRCPYIGSFNDGLDIYDCHGVVIRNCDILSGDDGICLKSDHPRGTKDVLVQNNRVWSSTNGLKIGTGSFGPIENVRFLDNTVLHAAYSGFTVQSVDGGAIRNILAHNLDISDCTGSLFIRLGDRLDRRAKVKVHTTGPGSIDGVTIEDVWVHDVATKQVGQYSSPDNPCANLILGIPGAKPRNISLKNIRIEMPGGETEIPPAPPEKAQSYPESNRFGRPPAYGLYVRHAANVKLEDITVGYLKDDVRKWLESEDATVDLKNCKDLRLIK